MTSIFTHDDEDIANEEYLAGESPADNNDDSAPLVDLRNVTRSVVLADDQQLHILRGVDLQIRVGDHTAIVGRSGCGKSTLLNILGLLDVPSSGQMLFDGTPVERLRSNTRAKLRGSSIGFVFQQFNLLPGRTALENVVTPLLYAGRKEFWRRNTLGMEILDRVGLAARAGTQPHMLSGGEQQRVAIARALVRRPRLILADEPTGALDVETGQAVMDLLDTIATESGAALVTITHDLNVAARARTRYRLDAGVLSSSDGMPVNDVLMGVSA
ncbi:ABC transporter ATP-binding protein [Arthrobacter glacialis]|uniref:ABC transporter ATP-binding protein n=1 Tax=Arthrobacter glacialis TaxID=1664 RepID=A0A2S4A0S5_ARTGL|nr:ABC transporter ATP-binding protein [Arthrobacter glacialis]POH74812.1 ABC transporter ATP-binding protein [Arthrobacter glacialis]